MKKITLVGLFVLFVVSMNAQKTLNPENLLEFERVGSEMLSSDGNWLYYQVTRMDVEKNKGFRRLERLELSTKNREVVLGEEWNMSQFGFTPDGKNLAFLSAKDIDHTQLWLAGLKGEEPQKVSEVAGGISIFVFSPKGGHVLLGYDLKMEKMVNETKPEWNKSSGRVYNGLMYRHWTSWADGHFQHLFLYTFKDGKLSAEAKDLLEGEKYHAPTKPFGGADEIAFSPDGKKVLYTCKKLYGTPAANSTNTDIYEYELVSGITRNLSEENKGYDKGPQYNSDGSRLAWLSMERPGNEADKNRIIVMEGSAGKKVDITKDFKYSVESFCWSKQQAKLYFIATIEATHQVFEYDFKTKKVRQITNGDYDYVSLQVRNTKPNEELIAGRMSISSPTAFYSIGLAGNVSLLIDVNAKLLANLSLGKVEKQWIKTTDGQEMLTWMIYPPNFDPNKKYPTLLYCQGGPQSPVSQFWSYRWNFQLMAAQGYIVVAPNRRGLPGFGQEWTDQIKKDYGGQAMKDLLSATDYAATLPYVDSSKLGAVGASFGGYSVYWLAGNHEKRFKTFISHCGMFNMESWYGSTEEMFFANDDNGPYWRPENMENYQKHSPHRYADKWDTPILVIHNELDYRVPLSEGLQAFTAAQQQLIPSKFLYFSDEGHWVTKPQNALVWQHTFFDWLALWLKK